jgi:hypothetical protein
VWEEKPGLLNMTATECILNSVVQSKGRLEAVGKAAAVGGADCKQQFMGHFSELAADAIVALCSCSGVDAWSAFIS